MLLNKVSLVALAVTFITASAVVARAESSVGVGPGGSISTSAALQDDFSRNHSAAPMIAPWTYVYTSEPLVRIRHNRADVGMRNHS